MAGWKGIIGTSFSSEEFDTYCHTLQWTAWRPSFIVVHNTGSPSLAQRPKGITKQHISNFEAYYRDQQKWKAGPHLFIDDKQIWVFTPLTVSGTHSPSWNKVALGIEMLGDFEKESFSEGRGLKVRENTIAALTTLCAILGFDPNYPHPPRRPAHHPRLPRQERAQARDHPGSAGPHHQAPLGRASDQAGAVTTVGVRSRQ